MPKPQTAHPIPERRAYPIPEFATLIGISRSTVYRMMTEGRLRSVWIGHRRLIPSSELDRLIPEGVGE